MGWLITKYLITAGVVVLASEIAKRNDLIGALIVALPLVSVLTLIWLAVEGQSVERIGNHAWYTFWYVLPTLPMFLVFPWLLSRAGFIGALMMSIAMTVGVFWIYARILRNFGIDLFP
jgi:uncharacterized membrane protein (GlpM family)